MTSMVVAETVPFELLSAVLGQHVGDPAARILDMQAEPILTDGYSGNQLYRAHIAWHAGAVADARSATWLLKRWLPGGHSKHLLGVDRPLEAQAWEWGLLRPEAQPSSVIVPIVGARIDPSGDAAWIVMDDVSTALSAYSRNVPLPPVEAVARVKHVLDGLARLHVWWEGARQQATLRGYSGLVPIERFLWSEAASYATALGRTPPIDVAPGSPVTDEFRANVHAFLAWLPAGDRALLEMLLYRREALVEALSAFPRTLLHGDADDRNIGLRPRAGQSGSGDALGITPDLVLIDWEWIAVGPPALDVARVCGSSPAVCGGTQPLPEALFSGELPNYYFDRYRAHGGTLLDRDAWRHSFALAFLANALTQVPFAGSMIRHAVSPVVAAFERQIEMLLPTAWSLSAL